MRRALFILNVSFLALLLVAWPVSYFRSPYVTARGAGVVLLGGRFYFAAPPSFMGIDHVGVEPTRGFDFEAVTVGPQRRWIPIRHHVWAASGLWVVEPWFVTIVLAVPAALLWRRRKRDTARGFEVQPKTDR